jgi:Zn-finger nucleic acid-binding protein
MCGASAKTEATRCDHCGARLATVACPSCFGLVFLGARFCSHCGARTQRGQIEATEHDCPRCKTALQAVAVGNLQLAECARCQGVWVDTASLDQLCADREKQAAVLGAAAPLPEPAARSLEQQIRYLPCPVCRKLMNRVNFARCSQVIVDVCKGHGTWFDRDELRGIVEFIRGGGLDVARAREVAELEERRRNLNAQRKTSERDSVFSTRDRFRQPDFELGLFSAARLIRDMLK